MKIVQVSESEFSVKGQGVHTAYREMVDGLSSSKKAEVAVNNFRAEADITHIQTVGPYSLWFLLFGRGKKVVSAHVVPASFVGSLVAAKYWLPLARRYLKWFYGRADLVCAVSNSVRDILVDDMGLKNRVEVTYNTIDMSKYQFSSTEKRLARNKLGIDKHDFVVLGIGQVQQRKRVDNFIEASKHSDAFYVWVGGIPFKNLGADYSKMSKLLTIKQKNLRMTGIVDHSEVASYIASADAFYLPAEQENHPMCVLEAAGASIPIILNDISEYDDSFRPDAIFVSDAKQACHAIDRLRNDKKYYQEMVRGSKRIAERFDSKAGTNRLLDLYRSILS